MALVLNLHRSFRTTALLAAVLFCGARAAAAGVVSGKVVDESGVVIAGASVRLAAEPAAPVEAVTDAAGRFQLPPVPSGTYRLEVEKKGYYAFVEAGVTVGERGATFEIVLNHRQEYEETVSVVYSKQVIDAGETAAETTLTSDEIVTMPFSATHDFRNALPLLPGAVKDNQGRVHLNGGGEDQVYYSLDGFNITNPVSGLLDNRISVDAIRSVRVESSRYSVEHGKGSAGTMLLETARGDDRFRFSATNFLPSYEFHNGLTLSNWTPRSTVSGPIARGRAWFSNALDLQYDLNIVDRLPSEANTNRNWTGSNLTRLQINLSPRNVLTYGFLVNFRNSRHFGITPLDPVETSRNRRERFNFFNVRDQIFLSSGWMLDAGVAVNRLETRIRPLGDEIYSIGPEGRSGNYFLYSEGEVDRVQMVANAMAPPRAWHGRHLVKFGIDANAIRYRQVASRNPFEILRQGGERTRLVSFTGEPYFGRDSFETSGYAQDRWSPTDRLLIELGARFDWDQILREPLLSPRVAVSWSPGVKSETKLSAGFGVFYDASNLGLLVRALDQQRTETFYGDDGRTVVRGPIPSVYTADERRLRAPTHYNWSLGWEQKLPRELYLRTSFIARRGRNGWTYDMEPQEDANLFFLGSLRRDRYRALEITLSRTFAGKHPWLMSYTRSSARSSAVIDFSLENPIVSRQGSGPLDWDAPNRWITWGSLPAPWLRKYTLAYFFEWHSGFPWSAVDDHQRLFRTPNSNRFPDYLSLNLHMERRFTFRRKQFALRAGFNNLTGHHNPVVVLNNIASTDFGSFYGGQGRVFTGRIRFLGRN